MIATSLQSAVSELRGVEALQAHIREAEVTLVVFGNSRTESWDTLVPALEALQAYLTEHLPVASLRLVDIFDVKEAITHYSLTTNPSFHFYSHGQRRPFRGSLDALELFAMVSKACEKWSYAVVSRDQLIPSALKRPYMYYEGQLSGEAWENYLNCSSLFDDLVFLHRETEERGRIWIIREEAHDGGDFEYRGDYSSKDVQRVIDEERYPTGVELESEHTAKYLFASRYSATPTLMLFYSAGQEELVRGFKKIGKKVKKDFLISTAKIENEFSIVLADSLGMLPKDVPSVWILKATSDRMIKYVMKEEISKDNVRRFANRYVEGVLSQHFRSEPVPERQEGAVITLVADTYDQYRNDENITLIVMYYANWCKHSQAFLPIFLSWAEESRELPKSKFHNMVFAKVDMARNEIPDAQEYGYPSIMCLRRYRELDEEYFRDYLIEFGGARTLEGLRKYMEEIVEAQETDSHAGEGEEEEEGEEANNNDL